MQGNFHAYLIFQTETENQDGDDDGDGGDKKKKGFAMGWLAKRYGLDSSVVNFDLSVIR